MIVKFYATLRRVVGGSSAQFDLPEGATVRQLIAEMVRCYPALRHEMLDEQGELYRHVHIFVNSRDANHLEQGLDTPLSEKDVVGVFPAVGGG